MKDPWRSYTTMRHPARRRSPGHDVRRQGHHHLQYADRAHRHDLSRRLRQRPGIIEPTPPITHLLLPTEETRQRSHAARAGKQDRGIRRHADVLLQPIGRPCHDVSGHHRLRGSPGLHQHQLRRGRRAGRPAGGRPFAPPDTGKLALRVVVHLVIGHLPHAHAVAVLGRRSPAAVIDRAASEALWSSRRCVRRSQSIGACLPAPAPL